MEKERISLEKLYKLLEFPAEVVERLGRVQLDKDEETMRDIHLLADREKWQGARARLKEKYAPDADGMKILACMMRAMQDSYALYIEEKIPEKIFADTMKCFTRFLKEHGVSFGCCGFDRDFWTGRQLSLLLFRLGELEFEIVSEDGEKAELSEDEKHSHYLLHVHIPSDADLSPERCDESFRMAEQFFAEYFPETAGSKFACDSWLLSPALKELLPEESRILQFQNRFEVKSWNKEEDAYLEWVFKRKDLPLEKLPEETSLQRKMKAYVLQGGKIGEAYGEIPKQH